MLHDPDKGVMGGAELVSSECHVARTIADIFVVSCLQQGTLQRARNDHCTTRQRDGSAVPDLIDPRGPVRFERSTQLSLRHTHRWSLNGRAQRNCTWLPASLPVTPSLDPVPNPDPYSCPTHYP